MMATGDTAHIERFRGIVANRLGLNFDDTKLSFLAEVLQRRRGQSGQTADDYLGRLESTSLAREELRSLASDLTVNETYFFRNPDQFRALVQRVLPARMAAGPRPRPIRVLSAGCASGEEAYSLAIALRENLPDASWSVTVRAVDINPAILEKARKGRYTTWSLRETTPQARQRWFSEEGKDFILDRSFREAVSFEERNIASDDPELWRQGTYDIVFCRNVMMYLTPENMRAVVGRIARSLMPGGFLFLGHAETLRGVSQDFHLEHTHDTFYYRSKTAAELADGAPASAAPINPAPAAISPEFVDAGTGWVDAIRRASEKIESLAVTRPAQDRRAGNGSRRKTDNKRTQLLDLLGREKFDDALALAESLPANLGQDADLLLLRAALLTHAARFQQAEKTCADLLVLDEMNAGAHYLIALCLEGRGDVAAAVEHDRIAAYLDPGFAMPRLHLGLLSRRSGDRIAARFEFEQALSLLRQEDAMRLLLFGGGFGREALVALCHAEFVACGGQS